MVLGLGGSVGCFRLSAFAVLNWLQRLQFPFCLLDKPGRGCLSSESKAAGPTVSPLRPEAPLQLQVIVLGKPADEARSAWSGDASIVTWGVAGRGGDS